MFQSENDENRHFKLFEKLPDLKIQSEEEHHDAANIFSLSCKCTSCTNFRKETTLLLAEEVLYSQEWRKLSEILFSFYEKLIPRDSPVFAKYEEYVGKVNFMWYTDGNSDINKLIQLAAGPTISPSLKISSDMKSLIIFDTLSSRDKHQLFELICLQIQCIALAYKDHLDSKVDFSDQGTLLTFFEDIFSACKHFCEAGKEMSRLFSDFEKSHLSQFFVDWQSINQWIFHKCVYSKYENFIPVYLIKLKQVFDISSYKVHALHLIKLDEDMSEDSKKIRKKSISAIISFKRTEPESERQAILKNIQVYLDEISQQQQKTSVSSEMQSKSVLDWLIWKDGDSIWENVLAKIKSRKIEDFQEQIAHVEDSCGCRHCVIFGCENQLNGGKKGSEDEHVMEVDEVKTELYHLSWALFKHDKERKPYTKKFIQPEIFCTFQKDSCPLKKCSVAASILIGGYPVNFTKFLLKNYVPLEENEREKIRKTVGDDSEEHFDAMKNMPWEGSNKIHISLASALAEIYGVAKFPNSKILISYFKSLFNTKMEEDIALDANWLEQLIKSTSLKKFLLRSMKFSWDENGDDQAMDEIENKMKFLSLTCEDGGSVMTDKNEVMEALETLENLEIMKKDRDVKTTMFAGVASDLEIKPVLTKKTVSSEKIVKEPKKLILKDTPVKSSSASANQKPTVTKKSPDSSKCDHSNETVQSQNQECVCHYCNLFEKENSNSRNYEMRTRLRKRLQQQQSRKSVKLSASNVHPGKDSTKSDLGQSKANQNSAAAAGNARQTNDNSAKNDKIKFQRGKEKSVQSDVIKETEHNMKPIDNLLEYIEGVEEKKVVKTKTKTKKPKKNTALLEEKKLVELESINGNLQSCEIQIKQYLNQLMQIRRGKQKDPARIKSAEDKLKEFTEMKSKYESESAQIIRQLKQMNSNFDIKNHQQLKYVISSVQNSQQSAAIKEPTKPSVSEVKSEGEKRMVTIRRINLPYSQPQVTVTAKGSTPDQDQLLYAFVNGHLVPGAMISSNKKMAPNQNAQTTNQQQPQMNTARTQQDVKQKLTEPPSNANVQKNNQQKTKDPKDAKKKDSNQKNVKKQPEEKETTSKKMKSDKIENGKASKTNKKDKQEEVKVQKPPKKTVVEEKKIESEKKPTKEVVTEARTASAYIDPEFDNNAFKLLVMDDSENESNTASSKSKNAKNKETANNKKTKNDKKSNNSSKTSAANNEKAKTKNVEQPSKKKPAAPTNSNKDKSNKNVAVVEETTASPRIRTEVPKPISKPPQNVNIDGLRLPPGITLTKVDYSAMENLRAKQNSINNITIPIEEYNRTYGEPAMHNQMRDPFVTQAAPFSEPAQNGKKNKSKKKKKKSAKEQQMPDKSDVVTLRNPMFNQNFGGDMSNGGMIFDSNRFNGMPPQQRVDQPASIIKNDNGMYTIRNPAFQNAFMPPLNKETTMPAPIGGHLNNDMMMGSQFGNSSFYTPQNPQIPQEDPFAYKKAENQQQQQKSFGPIDYARNKLSYENLAFLESLQPGQQLNSEVTIHNISESKFFKRPDQGQRMDSNNYCSQKRPDEDVYRAPPNYNHRNASDNVFAPNQTINLSELEFEEREIESFKRFDYFFSPPKNKPKVNINMKDIVVHSKKPVTTSSKMDEYGDS